MKLTESDRQVLKEWGYSDADICQIEEATENTIYRLNYVERISAKEAIRLLGRNDYLSGISRSSFHFTASREIENTDDAVSFDSTVLFK